MDIHLQRFTLDHTTLTLVDGSPKEVIDHVRNVLPNKFNLVASGARVDGERAMALYTEGKGFDGNPDKDRHTALSSALLGGILNGYDQTEWTFFSALSALKDKIDLAIGGALLGTVQAVQQFAKDLASAVFAKGGNVSGSTSRTNTLLLLAPDGERCAMAWNYETGKDHILGQPFGGALTRYSVAGSSLIAAKAGTGEIATMSFEAVKASLQSAQGRIVWNEQAIEGAQIDDLTLGEGDGRGGYTLIMSGTFQGEPGLEVITLKADGGSLKVLATRPTIRIDEQIAKLGSPVRFDRGAVTFVSHNGGSNVVSRVPVSALPRRAQSVFTDALAAA